MTTIHLSPTLTVTKNNNAKIIKRMKKLGVYQEIINKQRDVTQGHLLVGKDMFMWQDGEYWHYRGETQADVVGAFERLNESHLRKGLVIEYKLPTVEPEKIKICEITTFLFGYVN